MEIDQIVCGSHFTDPLKVAAQEHDFNRQALSLMLNAKQGAHGCHSEPFSWTEIGNRSHNFPVWEQELLTRSLSFVLL